MQFHLNGFKPGNYQVPDASRKPYPPPPIEDLPSEVDVLIVGTGPAGLTMARQMSEFDDISTCIVDIAEGPLLFGRADGISCRTIEIMEAFNSSEMVEKETYKLMQNTFWEPDAANPQNIKRKYKITDARLGMSEFTHGIVNQARLHELLLDGMANSITNLRPHYSRELVDLVIDENLTQDLDAHPITATFKRTDEAGNGKVETVKARFAVGSDGGRSRVRKSLDIALEGDSADKAWGVMDILLNTDFPDIRVKSFIQSKDFGAVMTIPREGGYLIRFYVELDLIDKDKRATDIKLTEQDIIAKAQKIFHPYTLDVKEVAWWSIYSVGQRLANRFDNRPADASDDIIPRAFLAGDACHTHSPKGGWGLNTSLPDTFNLGWKMAAVLQGRSKPALLAPTAPSDAKSRTNSLTRTKSCQNSWPRGQLRAMDQAKPKSTLPRLKPSWNAKAVSSAVPLSSISRPTFPPVKATNIWQPASRSANGSTRRKQHASLMERSNI